MSWFILRRVPRPSLDDPVDVPVAGWMQIPTGILLVGLYPACAAALGFNIAHVLTIPSTGLRIMFRCALLLILWGTLFTVLYNDPGGVLNWWFD